MQLTLSDHTAESIALCAGSTVAWFASAPFVSDRVEQQVHRPILPAASVFVGSMFWASGAALLRMKYEKRDAIERYIAIPPTVGRGRNCMDCRYFAGSTSLLFPCAIHPGRDDVDALFCRDRDQNGD